MWSVRAWELQKASGAPNAAADYVFRMKDLENVATARAKDGRANALEQLNAQYLRLEAEQAVKRRGQGHFQLSSEGHEALAGVAMAMQPGDWLHPHYRDRAIVMGRGVTHEEFFLDYYSKGSAPSGGRRW